MEGIRPSIPLAEAYLNRNHPRRIELIRSPNSDFELKFSAYPFIGSSAGSHPIPAYAARAFRFYLKQPASNKQNFTVASGRGVTLYFRFVKALAVCSLVISLIYLPSILVFSAGLDRGTNLGALSGFTLAALGEDVSVCSSGYERDSLGRESAPLVLACPANSVLRRVEGLYGAPTGSCECSMNNCTSGGPKTTYMGTREIQLPSGRSYPAGTCCTGTLRNGKPWFGDLDPVADPACRGDPAVLARILTGICWGKQSCNLALSSVTQQVYVPPLAYVCPAGSEVGDGRCSENLGAGTNSHLSTCQNTTLGLRMILAARCDSANVILQWAGLRTTYSVPRYSISLFVASLVFLGLCCLLFTIVSIREGERLEGKAQLAKALERQANAIPGVPPDELREGKTGSGRPPTVLHPSAADYTVVIEPLPPHGSLIDVEKELRAHLVEVLSRHEVVVSQLPNGVRIADVNFGLVDPQLLKLYQSRGKILESLERLARVKLNAQNQGRQDLTAKTSLLLKRAMQQLRTIDDSIDFEEHRISNPHRLMPRAIQGEMSTVLPGIGPANSMHAPIVLERTHVARAAFVTFDNEEGALRAIDALGGGPCAWACQPRNLRMRNGSFRLHARRAPEPSDVIWENVGSSSGDRYVRRFFTAMFIVCSLALALLAHFSAEERRRSLARVYPDTPCDVLYASMHSGNTTSSSVITPLFTKEEVVRDEYWTKFGLSTGNTGVLGCYCSALLETQGPRLLITTEFMVPSDTAITIPPPLILPRTLCADWLQTYLAYAITLYGAGILTLVLNLGLRLAITSLVKCERHTTRSGELFARGLYFFVVYAVNTTALLLLLNAYLDTGWSVLRGGEFSDFTAGWYVQVSVPLTLTMLLNIPVMQAPPLMDAAWRVARRCCDRGCTCNKVKTRSWTQMQLNELQLGSVFLLEERYAQASSAVLTCLLYSAGTPLLIPILFVTLTAQYWVDKILFLRCHRSPAKTSANLPKAFSALLPFACLVHASFAAWMLSYEGILPLTGQNDSEVLWSDADDPPVVSWASGASAVSSASILKRGFSPHITPLTVSAALLAAFLVMTIVSQGFKSMVRLLLCPQCAAACSCCSCCRVRPVAKGVPSWALAVPPDEAEAVIAGLKVVKPHLRRKLTAAMRVHTNVEGRKIVFALAEAYRTSMEAVAASSDEAQRARADLRVLLAKRNQLRDDTAHWGKGTHVNANRYIVQEEHVPKPTGLAGTHRVLGVKHITPAAPATFVSPGNPFGAPSGMFRERGAIDSLPIKLGPGIPFGAAPAPLVSGFLSSGSGNPFREPASRPRALPAAVCVQSGPGNPFGLPPSLRAESTDSLVHITEMDAAALLASTRPVIHHRHRSSSMGMDTMSCHTYASVMRCKSAPNLAVDRRAALAKLDSAPPVQMAATAVQAPPVAARGDGRGNPFDTEERAVTVTRENRGNPFATMSSVENTATITASTSSVIYAAGKEGSPFDTTVMNVDSSALTDNCLTAGSAWMSPSSEDGEFVDEEEAMGTDPCSADAAIAYTSRYNSTCLAIDAGIATDDGESGVAREVESEQPFHGIKEKQAELIRVDAAIQAAVQHVGMVEGLLALREHRAEASRVALAAQSDRNGASLSDGEVDQAEDSPFIQGPWTYDPNEDRDISASIGLESGVDVRLKRRLGAGITLEGLVNKMLGARAERTRGQRLSELSPEDIALEATVAEAGLSLNHSVHVEQ